MSQDDEDSIFEQALKGDLPSADEQARFRRRLFAAGLSAGSGLAATSAASAQTSVGATLAAKVLALSWPMTLVLGAAVATPIIALPVWLAPSKAKSAPSAAAPPRSANPAAKVLEAKPADVEDERVDAPLAPVRTAAAPVSHAASASVVTAGHAQEPNSAPSALPAVAAFAAPSSADSARSASTLAAETAILDRAFAEIAAGHRANAAALIAEHARRFPNGLLSQERERARARLAQSSQNSKAE